MPATVVVMNHSQERLKVSRPLMLPWQEQPSASTQVHRPEHGPACVSATEQDTLDLATRRPSRPQRREQQQIRLILRQQHTARRQLPDLPAEPPLFFSATPDRGPVGSVAACRYSPIGATRGGKCLRR